MKIAVVARDADDQKELEALVKKRKHKVVTKKPEMVICSGGDGTLLISERKYPGIPKVTLKDSEIGNKIIAYESTTDEVLATIERGAYSIEEHHKLQAQWKRKGKLMDEFVCTNDFMIRNQLLIQAVRFKITVDDKIVFDERLIGDGVVVCTPFGSTGYYESITGKNFDEGIGIALNNCKVPNKAIKTSRDKTIRISILRMSADFALDNDPGIETLEPGDEIIINASAEKMRLVVL